MHWHRYFDENRPFLQVSVAPLILMLIRYILIYKKGNVIFCLKIELKLLRDLNVSLSTYHFVIIAERIHVLFHVLDSCALCIRLICIGLAHRALPVDFFSVMNSCPVKLLRYTF